MSRKPDVWMPLFIGDYLADTAHLTTEQHGAYFLLLMAAWKREGYLPNDAVQLCAIARLTPARWRQHAAVILPLFQLDGDRLVQGRLADEYQAARSANDAQRENGKKGGRPKKINPNESQNKPVGFGRVNPNETPSPSPTPEASKDGASGHTPPAAAVSEPEPDRVGVFECHDDPPAPTPNPVAAFAIALTKAGLQCTSLNPDLVAYVDAGGTVDHLVQCAGLPEAQGKAATYAIRIARRELATTAAPVTAGRPRAPFPSHPSRQAQGVASILGVNAYELVADFARGTVVPDPDPAVLGDPVPVEPRRLSCG